MLRDAARILGALTHHDLSTLHVPGSDVGRARGSLRLLAQAIAGRALRVEEASSGRATYCDGRAIYVRASADFTDALVEVVVQAALVGAGSLDARLMRRLAGRRRASDRYLTLEASRAVAQLIEAAPGLAQQLSTLSARAPRSATSGESLQRARSREKVEAPPPEFGDLHPRRVLMALRRERPSSADVTSATLEEEDLTDREVVAGPEDPEETTFDPAEVEAHLAEIVSASVAAAAFEDVSSEDAKSTGLFGRFMESIARDHQPDFFRLLRRFYAPVREKVGGPQRDLPTGDRPVVFGQASSATVSLPRPGAAARAPRERVVGVYPEWDAQMGGYRRDWCTVLDAGPAEHTAEFPAACEDGFLARRLERLGLGLEQQRRRAQGDEIDLDAAVEMSVELAAGSVPDENVYRESVRRRRDLGVLVLLDVSGSSAEPSPLGARVHDHQRNAAAALLEALHRLGDRVACYAFFSRGRADVRVVRAKSFDEPFGGLVLQRLGGLRPQGFTRLGTAIRHGTALLERDSGVARRILVVLSDGQPYDFHRYEGAYGEADSRRALTEARLRGVGCLCLTIGGAGDPVSLRRVFGTAAHANARDLFEIRDQIGVLFRHALRLAERAARAPSRSSSHASEARP